MNDGDITALLDRLAGTDGEVENWDDVVERSVRPVRATNQGPPVQLVRRSHRRWALPLVGAIVALIAIVSLSVASIWRGGPTILDRATAAILTPASQQILYESITIRQSASGHRAVTHVHVWLDGAAPHHFRVTFDGASTAEVGGKLGGVTGLGYDSSNDVLAPVAFHLAILQSDLDPAAFIKKALSSGAANVEGRTTIRGHSVIRIRVSSRASGRLVPIALYFVDARTYRPVRVAIIADANPDPYRLGFPRPVQLRRIGTRRRPCTRKQSVRVRLRLWGLPVSDADSRKPQADERACRSSGCTDRLTSPRTGPRDGSSSAETDGVAGRIDVDHPAAAFAGSPASSACRRRRRRSSRRRCRREARAPAA